MTDKSVAFLMCVYRGDDYKFFEEALASILSQDYEGRINIYLCVDGEVDEKIGKVIEKNSDFIFKSLKNESGIGLASSLNSLIDILEGEKYVFRMDSDDICYPNRVSKMVDFMDASSVDVGGSWIEECWRDIGMGRTVRYPLHHDSMIECLKIRSPFAHPSVCFRASVFQKGIRYRSPGTNEDIALWFELARNGFKFGNLDEVLLRYNIDEKFFNRRGVAKAVQEARIFITGNYAIRGIGFWVIWPIFRMISRFLPKTCIFLLYRMRIKIFEIMEGRV